MKIELEHGKITITLSDEESIMATLQEKFAEVQASITDLQSTGQAVEDGLDTVLAELHLLRDQLNQGGQITVADLDSLMTQLDAARQPLLDSLSKEQDTPSDTPA